MNQKCKGGVYVSCSISGHDKNKKCKHTRSPATRRPDVSLLRACATDSILFRGDFLKLSLRLAAVSRFYSPESVRQIIFFWWLFGFILINFQTVHKSSSIISVLFPFIDVIHVFFLFFFSFSNVSPYSFHLLHPLRSIVLIQFCRNHNQFLSIKIIHFQY